MKRKILYRFLGIAIAIIVVAACKKGLEPSDNSVYLTMAESNATSWITVDMKGGEQALTVKVSEKVNQNVQVELMIDSGLVSAYNRKHHTAYSALPTGTCELSNNSVSIQAGTNISDGTTLRVHDVSLFKEGKVYLIPVTIKQTSALTILEPSRTVYFVVKRLRIANAASLANGNYFSVKFPKDDSEVENLTAITMETRVMANSFQEYSPFISSVMGIEENFLIRFGDVTIEKDQLQVAGGATAVSVVKTFSPKTWYHIAATYERGELKVYVDGELAATKAGVRTFNIKENFYFGKSTSQGRFLDGAISEAKIWSRALTAAELKNGACAVDPASKDLIAYWKFDKSEGRIVKDLSGHNRDAIATDDIEWIPNVRCQ